MSKRARTARRVAKAPRRGSAAAARWRWSLVGVVTALLMAAAVVVLSNRDAEAPHGGDAGEAFGHVHGLAVDPRTGALQVATHTGLYRVDGQNAAVRVSEDAHDLMGFTVAGPGHFLASGHPEAGGSGPANMGLIESTDGGATWHGLSLAGAADFHTLKVAHGAVYAYNSTDGGFMVSADRRGWERRSTLALGGFGVSPADPQTVLGVGRAGVIRSSDGGRTWQPVSGAPRLTVLTWDRLDAAWGVDGGGAVWQSGDGGNTWQRRGALPGRAQAIATHDATLLAAVADGPIVSSTDGGGTWTTRYSPA